MFGSPPGFAFTNLQCPQYKQYIRTHLRLDKGSDYIDLVETRGIEPRSNRGQSGGRYVRSLCFKIRGGGSRRQDTLALASLDLGRRPKGGTVIPAVFVTPFQDPTAEALKSALLKN